MEIKIACETKLYLPLENLTPFQGSLKDHGNKEKLKKQILEQGFAAPIFVWKNDGKYYILDGHGRCSALQDLKNTGYKIPDLPCVEIHAKTKREAKKKLLSYVSQFGKVTGAGLYEFITEAELDLEELEDFEIPEIDLEDFKEEFFPEDKPVGDGSEDEIPEVAQNELGVKLGDIFELGNHRLMCGDSTDLATVEKLMNGEKADMVFTDPPYGIDYQSNYRKDQFEILKNDDVVMLDWIPLAQTYSTGWFIFFFGWQRITEWLGSEKTLGKITNLLVWKKAAAMGDLRGSFSPTYELAFAWNRGSKLKEGGRPSAVFEYNTDSTSGFLHPTQKPIQLIEGIMSSLPPGSVLDLFGGSGSTLIACEKTKRRCYMMELDPHYCSVIIKRWEEYTGEKHKKLT